MNKTGWRYRLFSGALAFGVACGGAPSKPGVEAPTAPDSGGNTIGPAPVDNGSPSNVYPAYLPNAPQIVDLGGPKLKEPQLVVVTWPGDQDVDALENFADTLGDSTYWNSIVAEYGIGAAQCGALNHVRMTTRLPDTVTENQINDIVVANTTRVMTNGVAPDSSTWPAPMDNSIYVLFLPSTSKLTTGVKNLCDSDTDGYHLSTSTGVTYTVTSTCSSIDTRLDDSTLSASHEIAEAAVDPQPFTNPGFAGLDDAHLDWTLLFSGATETADICQYFDSDYREATGLRYLVQKQWSNASARSGHDPCVPQTRTYFNVTHLSPETIRADRNVRGGPKLVEALGLHIPSGERKTFQLGFYSDGPTPPWAISIREVDPIENSSTAHLRATVDKTSGTNGERTNVTVEATSIGPRNNEFLLVKSTNGVVTQYLPILIVSD